MNIVKIVDALAYVIFVFIVIIGVIVSGIEVGVDLIKYNVFGLEKPIDPEYSSGMVKINNFSDSYPYGLKLRAASDSDVFDVNDVTLDIYYGTFLIDEGAKYKTEEFQYDLVAFYVCDGGYEVELNMETTDYKSIRDAYFVFDIPIGNVYKDEYAYDLDDGYFYDDIVYKCKTNITIPSEFFNKNSDYFSLVFREYKYDEKGLVYIPRGQQRRIEISYKILDENTVDLQFDSEKN